MRRRGLLQSSVGGFAKSSPERLHPSRGLVLKQSRLGKISASIHQIFISRLGPPEQKLLTVFSFEALCE